MTVKVIRIVQYEGTEEAVRSAIQKSMTLGVRQCAGYTITIAEHLNELPPAVEMFDFMVEDALKGASVLLYDFSTEESGPFIDALKERESLAPRPVGCCCPPKGHEGLWAAGPCPVHHGLRNLQISTPASRERAQDALIEAKAIEIYNSWKELDGWVPWVTCGNSTMQGNARREARIALKL